MSPISIATRTKAITVLCLRWDKIKVMTLKGLSAGLHSAGTKTLAIHALFHRDLKVRSLFLYLHGVAHDSR